jgi:hypothetical protein
MTTEVGEPSPQVIQAYLADRLSETAARTFEEYCLENPEFAREVGLDLALKKGLRDIDTRRRSRILWMAVAAAASLAVVALLAVLRPVGWLGSHIESPAVYTAASDLPVPLRSADRTVATLIRLREARAPVIRTDRRVLEIRLLPDVGDGRNGYTVFVEVMSAQGSLTATTHLGQLDSMGYATLFFDSSQLVGKDLSITISPTGGANAASERFQVRVLASDSPPK